jgi:hypothetical protein
MISSLYGFFLWQISIKDQGIGPLDVLRMTSDHQLNTAKMVHESLENMKSSESPVTVTQFRLMICKYRSISP